MTAQVIVDSGGWNRIEENKSYLCTLSVYIPDDSIKFNDRRI